MIIRQIERITRSKSIDKLVVATSDQSSDDVLASILQKDGICVKRGPLDNVAQRFLNILLEDKPEHFVRLTADCPLIDPDVIDLVVFSHINSGCDYSTIGITRSFQHGLDVEVIRSRSFLELMKLDLTSEELEHVTMGIYNRPDLFSINQVVRTPDESQLRWTVDVPKDFQFVRSVYKELYDENPTFTTADVMNLLTTKPVLNSTAADYAYELEAKKL